MVDQSQPMSLNADQIERLQNAVRNRRSAIPSQEKRLIVPQEEYARRLREDIARDQQLAVETREKNLEKNMQQWQERIDERWRDAAVDNVEMSPKVREVILDKVKRWETGRGTNEISMLFAGLLGRGKTWSSYAYCHELIRRGLLTSGQIFIATEHALAAVASSGYEKDDRMRQLLSPNYKLYLIDDIGRGSFLRNESARGEIWFELLNHIYTRRLAFVGTTNLSAHRTKDPLNPEKTVPSSLMRWIGAASFERLGHMVGSSGYVAFNEDTRDMRKEKAEEWERNYRSDFPS